MLRVIDVLLLLVVGNNARGFVEEDCALEFSYHRRASGLRSLTWVLWMTVVFDSAIFIALYFLLPRPWNLAAAALGVSLIAAAAYPLTRVFRTRHRLFSNRLLLAFGRFRLEVPREKIAAVSPLSSIPKSAASQGETRPAHLPEEDTLYIVPHREGLVELRLVEPLAARLSRFQQPVEFTRIVLALDEPQAFLDAIRPSGADGASRRPRAPADGPAEAIPPGLASRPIEAAAPPWAGTPRAGTRRGAPSSTRECPGESPGTPVDRRPSSPADRLPLLLFTHPGTPGEAAIAIEHLTKRYGDFTAVNDVSLTVRPGEILAFLGGNGAGKSTTIRMMTGVLRPTADRVLILGRDVWKDGAQARRLLGYVPDTPILYESLTAQEFLWFVGGLYGLEPKAAKARADELLEMLQMTEWRDQLIRSFSLGMRRKMSIAAALMHRPQVLLLDEVTNGLDPRSARVVKDLILQEARRGASVFLTTHILDVASELAHRFAFIDRGRVLATGTWEEVEAASGLSGATLEELFLTLTDESHERSRVR